MDLTEDQKSKIVAFIPTFKTYLTSLDREADLDERRDRAKLFSGVSCITSIVDFTIAPPALKLYAVEPTEVDIITPSR